MAYQNRDVTSFAAGFAFLIGGSAVVGLGALAGIGVGGYYLGGVLGLAGAAAVGAGAGIIVGGLAVLTAIGFGIYGIVNACIKAHAKSKLRKQTIMEQCITNISETQNSKESCIIERDTIRADQIYDSTKNIMRATSASKIRQETQTVNHAEQPQVIVAAPVKQSFWSRLFGRRNHNVGYIPQCDVQRSAFSCP